MGAGSPSRCASRRRSSPGQLACRSEITNVRIAGSSPLRVVVGRADRHDPRKDKDSYRPATMVGVISPLEADSSGANSIARRFHVYPAGREGQARRA